MPKRYCEKCGVEMIANKFTDGFDRKTGEPMEYIRYICPEIKDRTEDTFAFLDGMYMGHYTFIEKVVKN